MSRFFVATTLVFALSFGIAAILFRSPAPASSPSKNIGAHMEKASLERLESLGFDRREGSRVTVFTLSQVSTTNKPMIILIPGANPITAIWSRRVTTSHGDAGTMFPYIENALKRGYSVVVLQPKMEGVQYFAEGMAMVANINEESTWEIIAHSRGGLYLMEWLFTVEKKTLDRISACHLLDSVHQLEPETLQEWLETHVVNFAASEAPGGTRLDPTDPENDFHVWGKSYIEWRSAGHETHEFTPSSAMEMVFETLDSGNGK
ncbi:hypothetical protein HK104_001238 [Borealophlyctis nickersoniae]|nr:hypothetical protein HK104_001238 [Borealophlyctis nickersoniae]